jgi:hypothetical protein
MTNSINADGLFGNGKFDVEHALDIYAKSYHTFPAKCLYDEELIAKIREVSRSFHIYLIGFTPKTIGGSPRFEDGKLYIPATCMGSTLDLDFEVPPNYKFVQSGDRCYFEDENGSQKWVASTELMLKLSTSFGGLPFLVKYIGQAYGDDGSRDAIDRLLKHETLQKIAIKGAPDGFELQVILLELQMDNRVITAFLPNAKQRDVDGLRRRMGLDKLYGTTEAERVSLYEASLIRHFAPEFNKEFKDSFPSTNLKILQDCYSKDFLAVVAEICIDPFPFYIYSEQVEKQYYHFIVHDLQKDGERRAFFAIGTEESPSTIPS